MELTCCGDFCILGASSFREIWILPPRLIPRNLDLAPHPFREIWGPGPASLPAKEDSGQYTWGSAVVVLWGLVHTTQASGLLVHRGSALGVSGSAVHSIQRNRSVY